MRVQRLTESPNRPKRASFESFGTVRQAAAYIARHPGFLPSGHIPQWPDVF